MTALRTAGGGALTTQRRSSSPGPPRPTGERQRGAPWTGAAAEVALAGVTAAAVLGLTRLFSSASFLPPVLLAAVASHGLAAVTRRARINPLLSDLLSGAGLALFVVWVVEPHTTTLGVPGGATWDQIRADLADGWERFSDVVAPTEVTRGFVLASVVGAWLTAHLADAFAFRLRTRFEALVPSFTVFLFGAILGADRHRVSTSAAYLGSVLLFVIFSDAAGRANGLAWFGGRARRGDVALLRSALAVGAVAVVAAVVIGPVLPDAQSAGVVAWRDQDRKSRSRVTVSPLVDIRSRLVDQSDTPVFAVTAEAPTYWRLTALDRFDGTIWSSMGSYRSARDDTLPGPDTSARESTLRQDVEVQALSSVWLPAAYRPERLEGLRGARFDRNSSSLLTDQPSSDGLRYTVVSALPQLSAPELASASDPPAEVAGRYLDLPPDLPPVVGRLANEVAGSDPTPYGRAKALQEWFRSSFTYSTDIPPGHDENAILRFLRTRQGYCEQFAGTYAAMARTLGLPSRVAVGFTPGQGDGQGRFQVTGRNAHAWPEVYIGDYGWVAFEPTPGRGMPGAEDYTGVPPDQDEPEQGAGTGPGTVTTTTAPAQATAGTGASTATTAAPEEGAASAERRGGGNWLTTALVAAAALAATYLVGVPLARRWLRNRRRAAARTPTDRVLVAWTETEEALAGAGIRRRPAETAGEYTARVERSVADPPGGLGELASAVSAAAYSPSGVSTDTAGRAEQRAAQVVSHMRAGVGAAKRLLMEMDPRPLLPGSGGRPATGG